MTTTMIDEALASWEAEGRRLGESFDEYNAAVITGPDVIAAAQVALGIGRMQARRRRVAVADLVGEVAPLQELIPEDAEHGIVDSFTYGVSLTRIAYPIDPAKNLYVMPSGSPPLDYETLLRTDRWRKLAEGFKEVDALLLVVVPPSASGLEELISSTDGCVIVGGGRRAGVPGRVLADVHLPDTTRRNLTPIQPLVMGSQFDNALSSSERNRRIGFFGGIAVLLLALAGWAYFTSADSEPAAATDSALVAPAATQARPAANRSRERLPVVEVANTVDSALAVEYSVEVMRHTALTKTIAELENQENRRVPAATYSPVVLGNDTTQWFRLIVGAYGTQTQADSLLQSLRARRALSASEGRVVQAPFALLVEHSVPRQMAAANVRSYRAMGLPVYALLQDNGVVNLYAGAFETPEHAAMLIPSFRQPVQVVYRTGRTF